MGRVEQTPSGVSLLHVIRRYWLLVVAVTLVAGLSGYAFSYLVPAEYRATTRLYLTDPQASGVFGEAPPLGGPRSRVYSGAAQVTSAPVLRLASETLGDEVTPASLGRRVTAEAVPDLEAILVRATAPTAAGAARTVDAVATAYREVVMGERRNQATTALAELEAYQDRLRERLGAADAELANLRTQAEFNAEGEPVGRFLEGEPRYDAAQAERSALYAELLAAQRTAQQVLVDTEIAGAGVFRVEPARVPDAPIRPRRALNAAVAGLLGLVCSGVIATLWEEHQRSPDDPRRILGRPLLGEVPHAANAKSPVAALVTPGSAVARASEFIALMLIETLRAQRSPGGAGTYAAEAVEGAADVVLISGLRPGSGATTTTLLLGAAIGRSGRRVLLVDATFSEPGLSQLAGADVTARRPGPEGYSQPQPISADVLGHELPVRVTTLDPGFADPFTYCTSGSLAAVLGRLRQECDVLVLDAPPLLEAAETLVLARLATAIVPVVDGTSTTEALEEARRRLELAGRPVLGYVFNHGTGRPPGGLWGLLQGRSPYLEHSDVSVANGRGEGRMHLGTPSPAMTRRRSADAGTPRPSTGTP